MKKTPLAKVSTKQKAELQLRRKLKSELTRNWDGFCMTCGGIGDFRGFSLSHIIALSNGGKTTRGNCLIECGVCHDKYEKRPELRDERDKV